MPTTTTNFGLNKPIVDSPTDQDLWGTQLNTNTDGLDTLLKTAINTVKSSKTLDFNVTAPTSGSTTVGDSKKVFLCDATSGAMVASLPAASSAGDGFTAIFKKTDYSANGVTLMPDGSETIDGAASYTLSTENAWVIVACDGVSNWNIIGVSIPVSASTAIANQRILSNISGGTADPSANTLTAIIDNILGSSQGSILYRGSTAWTVLTAGTSGQVLRTNGAGANPSWTTISGSYVSTDQNYNAVGSFCFAKFTATSTVSAGSTTAGSNLLPAGIVAGVGSISVDPTTGAGIITTGSTLTGTWRCLGYAGYGSQAEFRSATLWQRIA